MTEKINVIVTTLLINGFKIELVDRLHEDNCIIVGKKLDIFGASLSYAILVNLNHPSDSLVKTLQTTAEGHNATPLIVSDHLKTDAIKTIGGSDFEKLLGGFVNTGLVTLPNLPVIMKLLGHNQVPDGLEGEADELLEIYTKECLRYLMCAPANRFGSDRVFEKLPDGIVLGGSSCNLLFDAKAYAKGFAIEADDIRRFSSYVEDFNERYRNRYVFRYFLLVSGHFKHSDDSLKNRSDELFNSCGARLCCITAEELGKLSKLFISKPLHRNAIRWENVFVKHCITATDVKKEMTRIEKDKLL